MSGAGPTLFLGRLPSWSLFQFPPDTAPPAIPPPYDGEPTFKALFPISAETYNAALDYRVPLTIATVYATSVLLLNKYNRTHGNKAWAISKTRVFKAFVILHNVGLAVYSAITCYAMVRALKLAIPHYSEPDALVGAVDALCKMHGPRGLGDAATFNSTTHTWTNKNPLIRFGSDNLPDSTDVGRVWNEGLSFWGWIFYLSKFYEVLDTAIIIMKGKRSTTLQTYHHAGAMLSMWAGIRFMSPPIWMFALVNSGIHAMMYTYYTVSALGIRVPQAVKRSLTTLQILQFIVGVAFAGAHLFVAYSVPVSVTYQIAEQVIAKPSSAISTALASIASATATAVASNGAWLNRLLYRAAGEEGLAENVDHSRQAAQGIFNNVQQAPNSPSYKTVTRNEYQTVPCIDTPGQTFAIYLNLIYLAPLTGLFTRFFIKSYIRRTSPNAKHPTKKRSLSKSASDAIHGVDREIESLGRAAEDGIDAVVNNPKSRGRNLKPNGSHRAGSLSPENQRFIDNVKRKSNQVLEKIGEGSEASRERAKALAKEVVETGTPKKSGKKENGAAKKEAKKEEKRKGSACQGEFLTGA
ncbi:hypothetical protein P154DRAFT_548999 [Amniculicola lignicola CBS 123094]|uniref:Elongation of fatty acids protein n=1 Tax=Amniculicola lignicola CBS 123094 TaxID=1392246 RepID=A0A6A5W600_9PLEO|nr:hypothetical protein P154DRAFT_548999 [Amniculicola lignicola CBS 123094]